MSFFKISESKFLWKYLFLKSPKLRKVVFVVLIVCHQCFTYLTCELIWIKFGIWAHLSLLLTFFQWLKIWVESDKKSKSPLMNLIKFFWNIALKNVLVATLLVLELWGKKAHRAVIKSLIFQNHFFCFCLNLNETWRLKA